MAQTEKAKQAIADDKAFVKELAELINRHSVEGRSGTPDFVLAKYLYDTMIAYNRAVRDRAKFHHVPLTWY